MKLLEFIARNAKFTILFDISENVLIKEIGEAIINNCIINCG